MVDTENTLPAGVVPFPVERAMDSLSAAGAPPWRLLEQRRLDPGRPVVGSYPRTTDFRVSTTDSHSPPLPTGPGTSLGYHDHYVVDEGKARIILATLVTAADVMENVPPRDLL